MQCNGSATGILTKKCPTQREVSTCVSLNNSSTFSCRLVDFTETNTTCLCTIASAESSSGSESITRSIAEIDVVSMLNVLQVENVATWQSTELFHLKKVEKSMDVVLLLGGIVVFLIIGIALLPRLDARMKLKVAVDQDDIELAHTGADLTGLVINKERLMEAVPPCFKSNYSIVKFIRELPRYHRWISPFWHYSETIPRVYRMVSLANQVIAQIFFMAVFHNMNSFDDGSCEINTNRSSCLSAQSKFNFAESKCDWDGGACSFRYLINKYNIYDYDCASLKPIIPNPYYQKP